MNIYLLGSVAFDEVSRFNGRFTDVIKLEHLGKLSVCFIVEDKKRCFGGCAGNIAYSLGLLGASASVCSLIGQYSEDYLDAMKAWGINTKYLKLTEGQTASAFITTDLDENQIAYFAPGVIGQNAPDFELPDEAAAGDILLVSPEQKNRMLSAVQKGSVRKMQVFFDPGQMIHEFGKEDLLGIIENVQGLFLNEYEAKLFSSITGLSEDEISKKVDVLFVTKGAGGVSVYENGEKHDLAASKVEKASGPTGAGDAFRAGVLAAMQKGLDLKKAASAGVLMGAACVQHEQTQGHTLNEDLKRELKKLGFA